MTISPRLARIDVCGRTLFAGDLSLAFKKIRELPSSAHRVEMHPFQCMALSMITVSVQERHSSWIAKLWYGASARWEKVKDRFKKARKGQDRQSELSAALLRRPTMAGVPIFEDMLMPEDRIVFRDSENRIICEIVNLAVPKDYQPESNP